VLLSCASASIARLSMVVAEMLAGRSVLPVSSSTDLFEAAWRNTVLFLACVFASATCGICISWVRSICLPLWPGLPVTEACASCLSKSSVCWMGSNMLPAVSSLAAPAIFSSTIPPLLIGACVPFDTVADDCRVCQLCASSGVPPHCEAFSFNRRLSPSCSRCASKSTHPKSNFSEAPHASSASYR